MNFSKNIASNYSSNSSNNLFKKIYQILIYNFLEIAHFLKELLQRFLQENAPKFPATSAR